MSVPVQYYNSGRQWAPNAVLERVNPLWGHVGRHGASLLKLKIKKSVWVPKILFEGPWEHGCVQKTLKNMEKMFWKWLKQYFDKAQALEICFFFAG